MSKFHTIEEMIICDSIYESIYNISNDKKVTVFGLNLISEGCISLEPWKVIANIIFPQGMEPKEHFSISFSIKDGIAALRNAHMHTAPSLTNV